MHAADGSAYLSAHNNNIWKRIMVGLTRRSALAGAVIGAAASGEAFAQAYPSRTVRVIVPYTPGGITDIVTRLVAEQLGANLGQQFIIDNRPGANSMIGADALAKSEPDGYTLGTVIGAHSANATLYAGRIAFDPVGDFTPVSLIATSPLVMCSSAKLPFKDYAGFVAYAKANPGKLSFGSSGVGSAAHLTSENLKRRLGIDMVHVPFRGTGPALTALMSGDIGILLDTLSSLKPQMDAGTIHGIAIAGQKRSAYAPDVPTYIEAGLPDFVSGTWVMLLGPKNLPAPILDRLSKETMRITQGASVKTRLEGLGIDPVGSTPAEALAFLKSEVAKWGGVIREAQIKVE